MTEQEKRVLDLFKETESKPKYTYRQIGSKLGISGQRVGQIVKRLREKGVINA